MKPTTAYIPIPVKVNPPIQSGYYIVIFSGGDADVIFYNGNIEGGGWNDEIVAWLEKKKNVFVLNEKELEKFYADAFDEGSEEANGDGGLTFEEYLNLKSKS